MLDVFSTAQAWLRRVAGEEHASWPNPHTSIHVFGTAERPLDEAAETKIIALAQE